MKKISLKCAAVVVALGPLYPFAFAADIVKAQPRKKFKLHAVTLEFKTSDMISPRVIPEPSYQAPGVIIGDAIIYTAKLDPPLTLPDARYSWVGGGSSFGATAVVSYTQAGDQAIVANVLDLNSNTNKFVGVAARARSVGTNTEAGYCTTSGTAIAIICSAAAQDAQLATDWSRSVAVGVALGLGGASSADNGKSNAAMHSYWNVLMTRDGGADVAENIATAHEKLSVNFTGIDAGDAHNSSVMDLDNNARGRQIAAGIAFVTTPGTNDPQGQTAIIAAVNAGTMTRMDIVSNPGRGGLLEPSNK